MSLAPREEGKIFGSTKLAVKEIDFSTSERNFTALVKFHYSVFDEYVPDGEKMYERGEVTREGSDKYMCQNQTRIDPNSSQNKPSFHPQFKLFRDAARLDPDGTPRLWLREEWVILGFERYEDQSMGGRPEDEGWYRCYVPTAGGNNTRPSALPNIWEKLPE